MGDNTNVENLKKLALFYNHNYFNKCSFSFKPIEINILIIKRNVNRYLSPDHILIPKYKVDLNVRVSTLHQGNELKWEGSISEWYSALFENALEFEEGSSDYVLP